MPARMFGVPEQHALDHGAHVVRGTSLNWRTTAPPCSYVCGWIRLQAGQEVRVKLHAFSVHLHADPFVGTVHACQVAAVGL